MSLLADVSGFMANLSRARAATTDFARGIAAESQQNRAEFDELGRGISAVGLAAGAGIAVAVTKFAEFDQQMSFVQAATHETAGNMDLLRQAAVDAGASTVYSATEAGGAIEELAKAGISTTDVLAGGLSGSLDLAAAGGLEVADAATIAATALTQFGLAGSDIPHVADLLAAGAGKAQGSVEDLGAALNQSGLVADQTGLTIEETTGTLAAFAAAGLTGSDAGTSFKTMLQALTPTSGEAKEKMDELGISAYDAQGNFIGMEKFAGVLANSLSGLSVEQQNAAMKTIFGADAVRAASVVFENGAEGIGTWIDAVDDSGYAADTAAQRLDNLMGDLEGLGGAFDSVMIGIGESADGGLRTIVQMATGIVQAFTNLSTPSKDLALGMGLLVTAFGLTGGAALVAIPKIVAFRTALTTLGTEAPKTAAAVGMVGKAFGALALVAVADWAARSTSDLVQMGQEAIGVRATVDGLAKSLSSVSATPDTIRKQFDIRIAGIESGVSGLSQLTNLGGLSDLTRNFKDFGADLADHLPVLKLFGNGTADTTRRVKDMDAALAQLVAAGNTKQAAVAWKELQAQTDGSKEALQKLRDLFPQYTSSAQGAANATTGLTSEQADAAVVTKENEDALSALSGAATDAQTDISALADAISNFGSTTLNANAAAREFQAAIDAQVETLQKQRDAYAEANGTLDGFNASLDIGTTEGRENQAALDAIAQSAFNTASATLQQTGSQEQATEAIKQGRAALIDALAQFGITGQAAENYANNLHLIPEDVATAVELSGVAAAEAQIAYLTRNRNIAITTTVNSPNGAAFSDARASAGSANGNIFAYANGGFPTGIYAGRAGSIHKFAEPETRWEAYISGKPGQERRNIGIWADAGKRLGVFGGSRPSYVAAGYGGSSGGAGSTKTIAPVVNQNGVFYSYDPSRMAKEITRKQSQALALYDN
ncbi:MULTISPECIES: phage tail tape measure protein [unclassified Rathayibacter]|uniref:phage tail tape measure protein n=1 Tax=unclassified Rathayibacter TaxID=2609250 RepID=UPI001405602D|nr:MULTISPECIES: phage tail tape measure protein [unclassified Rathayibacter]